MYKFRDFYTRKPWWHHRRWQVSFAAAALLVLLLFCVKLIGRKSDDLPGVSDEQISSIQTSRQEENLQWVPDTTADRSYDPWKYQDNSLDGTRRVAPKTHYPPRKERLVSGPNDPEQFRPEEDIIEYHDSTIWWESDHDGDRDTEDDHQIHRDILPALVRLNALVLEESAVLKIQDAYRDEGIHSAESLHREGRALDLTAEGMSLARLAQLSVQAGFDWVYYESPAGGGAHVHASVIRKTHMGREVSP